MYVAKEDADGFWGFWDSLGMWQLPIVLGVFLLLAAVIAFLILLFGKGPEMHVNEHEARQPRPSKEARDMYNRVGVDAIRVAVDQFYNRVLADPRLEHYFQGLDAAARGRLRQHQARFVGQVLGGPVHFELSRIMEVHNGLKISNDDYWYVVHHLLAVLSGLGVEDEIVGYVADQLAKIRIYVVAPAITTRT